MSYPLIILGAGASFDYSYEGAPGDLTPLTDKLVDKQHLDLDLLEKYEGVSNLLADIGRVIKSNVNKKTFEEALTDFQTKMTGSTLLKQQFIALEFYLQELFKKKSTEYITSTARLMHSINNYRVLINLIEAHSSGKACVVTFNYDTLFERNLPTSQQPVEMGDYIDSGIKIIKLHGSHDWVYRLSKSQLRRRDGIESSFEICRKTPNLLINDLKQEGHVPLHEKESELIAGYIHFPAVAVPLVGKDRFICPKSHIDALEREIENIDRILIIGWKAGDKMLLNFLRDKLSEKEKSIPVFVIAGSEKESNEIIESLKISFEGFSKDIKGYSEGGFSSFMQNSLSEEFFK